MVFLSLSKLPSIHSLKSVTSFPSNMTFHLKDFLSEFTVTLISVSVCVYCGKSIFTVNISDTVISFEYSYFLPFELNADAQSWYWPAVLNLKLPPLSLIAPSIYSSIGTSTYSCVSSEYFFKVHSIDFTYWFIVSNSIKVSVYTVFGTVNSTVAVLFDELPPPLCNTFGVIVGVGKTVGVGVGPTSFISNTTQNILNTSPRVIFP